MALRWSDIDLATGKLKVERSLEHTVQQVRVKEPKTRAGRRSISLDAFAVAELRAHWKAQQEERLKAGIGKGGKETLVFGPLTGELPRPDTLTKQWAKFSQDLGLNVRFHALRHTFASMMIKAGVDVLSLSRRLGHGKPSLILDVYCHMFGNDEGKIVQALNAAFSSVRKENLPAIDR